MKRIFFTLFASCFYMVINAQQTDSIDNIVFKIQPGWKVVKQSSFTELTLMDKNIRGFCQLAIYRQQPSSDKKKQDFEKEWKELVEKNFTMITSVKPIAIKDKMGNSILRY